MERAPGWSAGVVGLVSAGPFDGENDEVDIAGRMVGFDLTSTLENPEIVNPCRAVSALSDLNPDGWATCRRFARRVQGLHASREVPQRY